MMERRTFLHVTGAAAAGLMLPGATCLSGFSVAAAALARPDLLNVLGDPRLVCEIGVAYRAACPGERDVDALRAALLKAGRVEGADASGLPARLNRQVRDDFGAGRTVVVKGWVLAVTEARQCALFSLLYA